MQVAQCIYLPMCGISTKLLYGKSQNILVDGQHHYTGAYQMTETNNVLTNTHTLKYRQQTPSKSFTYFVFSQYQNINGNKEHMTVFLRTSLDFCLELCSYSGHTSIKIY